MTITPPETHLSLDIETLGTHVDAPVLSIGAVWFDPWSGHLDHTFYMVIDLGSALTYGRPSAETLKWWLDQDSTARRDVTAGRSDLKVALDRFAEFYERHSIGDAPVWANGPSFDIAILEHAYRTALNREPPWSYNMARDLRTLRHLAGDLAEPPPFEGTKHNALDDAMHQARWISLMWQALRVPGATTAVPTELLREAHALMRDYGWQASPNREPDAAAEEVEAAVAKLLANNSEL